MKKTWKRNLIAAGVLLVVYPVTVSATDAELESPS